MPDPIQSRLDAALAAAEAAGQLTLNHFAPGVAVETKRDGSPVTIADRAAETAIRTHLSAAFPRDALEGEEHPHAPGDSGYTWIIDPIDGTYSFVRGVPLYGTLIGLEHDGQLVAGVVHMPALNETIFAARGHGAWHRVGRHPAVRARVSTTPTLADALVCTTSYDYFRDAKATGVIDALHHAAGHTRGWSDCYAAVLLATGRADAILEPVVHPWDIAAIWPIVAEAGGRCTDWAGRDTVRGRSCIMSNGPLHDELLELVANAVGSP
jgi:histidinol phosphatase-like enzyme (inositol monophosphatase family)